MEEIGDINGAAISLTNMGVLLFEQQRPEEAAPLLLHAYRIFEQIGSPNLKVPKSYLNAIIGQIGEARFEEIINSTE